MGSRKIKPNWASRFVVGGLVLGFIFWLTFVRTPHWVGSYAEAINALLAGSFLLGGAYTGEWFYKKYGCSHGFHSWELHDCPTSKRCISCGRTLLAKFDQSHNIIGWEEGSYLYDPALDRLVWRPTIPGETISVKR